MHLSHDLYISFSIKHLSLEIVITKFHLFHGVFKKRL